MNSVKSGNDIIRISTSSNPAMFGAVEFVSKRCFKKYRGLWDYLYSFRKYLPFSEPEVTILSPRTVLDIRFRPGQAYLFGMDGISPKIWRHHKPEVASSKFQLRRIPSSCVPLD